MTRRRSPKVVVVVMVVLLLATLATGATAAPKHQPLKASPQGASITTWATRWWQWAFSLPFDEKHPFFDETGEACMTGQPSSGFLFLVGVFNVSGKATRNCTIPDERGLFFPAINVECSSLEGGTPWYGKDEASLEACVSQEAFQATEAHATLDGKPLAIVHVPSSPVTPLKVTGGWGNYFWSCTTPTDCAPTPEGTEGIFMTSGEYVWVPPLSPGKHVLNFGGTQKGGFSLDITYNLTVVE